MTHERPKSNARQRSDASPSSGKSLKQLGSTAGSGRLRLRHIACVLLALAAVWSAAMLAGCGTGIANSFSGGGVPIGGSRVAGRVVSAENSTVNIPNVAIQIDATPQGGVTNTLRTMSAADGTFNFANVLPGFSNGTLVVTATPQGAGFQAEQIAFSVANGHTQQMILTLPPASFDNTTAASVALTLPSPAVPSGGSVQVDAVVRDSTGKVLPVKPTLVFDGNFGTLDADGVFSVQSGTLSGMGSITAFWYRLQPQTTQIRVDNSAPEPPPNPPVLPGSQDDAK